MNEHVDFQDNEPGRGQAPALALPPLIVVLGPTASGKSALGIELARRFHGEIVSADSRQVYRGLDVGTAKVTLQEQALARHHLLDVVDPCEVYTSARFQQEAIAAINDILARGSLPLLVGGSPHYIQAVVDHLQIPHIEPQPAMRAQLEARPLAELLAQLAELDPQSAASIDRNNPRRVIRALGLPGLRPTILTTTRRGRPALPLTAAGHFLAARGVVRSDRCACGRSHPARYGAGNARFAC